MIPSEKSGQLFNWRAFRVIQEHSSTYLYICHQGQISLIRKSIRWILDQYYKSIFVLDNTSTSSVYSLRILATILPMTTLLFLKTISSNSWCYPSSGPTPYKTFYSWRMDFKRLYLVPFSLLTGYFSFLLWTVFITSSPFIPTLPRNTFFPEERN
jgi:hypothetical protein